MSDLLRENVALRIALVDANHLNEALRERLLKAESVVEDVREWWAREENGPAYNGHTRDSDHGRQIWLEWWNGNLELAGKVKDALEAIPTTRTRGQADAND